jgi:glutathione S-transferase
MYDLVLGDRGYSSWSMRIGLLVDHFDLPVSITFGRLYTEDFRRMLAGFAPARTVPALRLPEGVVMGESLAIAEELADRFPDLAMWPADPAARAIARSLAAEMHSGFAALRSACPMNLRRAYRDVPVSAEVRADLDRIAAIWAYARKTTGAKGAWLCGEYGIVDAFYAPVAARIAGYALDMPADARAYVEAHLAHPAFRRWREAALTEGPEQPAYDLPFPRVEWPALATA